MIYFLMNEFWILKCMFELIIILFVSNCKFDSSNRVMRELCWHVKQMHCTNANDELTCSKMNLRNRIRNTSPILISLIELCCYFYGSIIYFISLKFTFDVRLLSLFSVKKEWI